MPPNPHLAYRGAKATSTGPVTPTPGLATVSTSTPVMASASSQLATLTALLPPQSSQGTSGNVQGPKRMRYDFLKYTQPPVATQLAIEVINNANNAMDAVVDAPQSAVPPIVVLAHRSLISAPSPRPPQEEPQSVDPPVFVPSHISPASVPSPPPSKEVSQSAAPLQVPQDQSLPKSEEDAIEHMVSTDPHLIQDYTPEPVEESEDSSLPPTRRKMLIQRQIDHLYGLENEMWVMYDIVEEIREAFEELAAEEH
ncbi:hypothetical protein EI94DRAFT_1810799 [Lactarius quietus]|nr:hypothetical protein EI94DRAFT_1810799 [Lactarius quietus]